MGYVAYTFTTQISWLRASCQLVVICWIHQAFLLLKFLSVKNTKFNDVTIRRISVKYYNKNVLSISLLRYVEHPKYGILKRQPLKDVYKVKLVYTNSYCCLSINESMYIAMYVNTYWINLVMVFPLQAHVCDSRI